MTAINQSGIDVETAQSIKTYAEQIKREKLSKIDNYAVLKSYGIDTRGAGDFKYELKAPDGTRISKVVSPLGPAALAEQ